jgi:hypothetical protein
LSKLAYLSLSQLAGTFFAPDLVVDSPPSHLTMKLLLGFTFSLVLSPTYTDVVFLPRIQGDSQGMEGPQEGGRVSA